VARTGQTGAIVVLLRGGVEVARWPLAYPGRADIAVVDRLARAQLSATRAGMRLQLRHAGAELLGLLELAGLRQVLGEPEGREEVGVEEVVVADDPVA
jgi:hypothetical protein